MHLNMERLRLGLDFVEVARIQRGIQRRSFVRQYFASPETVYCDQASGYLQAQRYAGRWAAKEAALKTLREPLGPDIPMRDIVVLSHPSGQPYICLEGQAKKQADWLGISSILTSISHDGEYAGAICLAILDPNISEDIVLPTFILMQEALAREIPLLKTSGLPG